MTGCGLKTMQCLFKYHRRVTNHESHTMHSHASPPRFGLSTQTLHSSNRISPVRRNITRNTNWAFFLHWAPWCAVRPSLLAWASVSSSTNWKSGPDGGWKSAFRWELVATTCLCAAPSPFQFLLKKVQWKKKRKQRHNKVFEFLQAELVTGAKVQCVIQVDVRHGDGQAVKAEGSRNQTKVQKNNTGERYWSNYTVMTMMCLRRETELECSGDAEENQTQVQDIRAEHVITQAGNLTGSRE